jgi:hypothetical protein
MILPFSKDMFHLAAIKVKQVNMITSSQRIDFVCLTKKVTSPKLERFNK